MQMRTIQGLFSFRKTKKISEAETTCKAGYNLKSKRRRWGGGGDDYIILPCMQSHRRAQCEQKIKAKTSLHCI